MLLTTMTVQRNPRLMSRRGQALGHAEKTVRLELSGERGLSDLCLELVASCRVLALMYIRVQSRLAMLSIIDDRREMAA